MVLTSFHISLRWRTWLSMCAHVGGTEIALHGESLNIAKNLRKKIHFINSLTLLTVSILLLKLLIEYFSD